MTLPHCLLVRSSDPENVLSAERETFLRQREDSQSCWGSAKTSSSVVQLGRPCLKDLAFVSCISDFLRNEECKVILSKCILMMPNR